MAKKVLSLVLSLVMLISVVAELDFSAFAQESGQCGENLIYIIDSGTLTISGIGDMFDYEFATSPFVNKHIKRISFDSTVTSIGDYAFFGCMNLLSIFIPNSIKKIGASAFELCTDAEFISISENAVSIGESAFKNCSKLSYLEIPQSVNNIGENAFSGCKSINQIVVDPNNNVFDSRNNCNAIIETKTNKLITACNETVIPNTVVEIGNYAFSGCSSISSINIPNSVVSIGDYAFNGCMSIESITIPNSVSYLGERVFEMCTGLTSVVLPSGVSVLHNYLFENCKKLSTATIPKSIVEIGSVVFPYPLSVIYYGGTEKQWRKINYHNDYSFAALATIYYEDCAHPSFIETVEENPTCLSKGKAKYECSDCYYSYYVDLPATGHNAVIDKAVSPTCTKDGKTKGKHCSKCGTVLQKQTTIQAKGHSYNKGNVTVKPTSSKAGTLTQTCTVCKSTKKTQIAKLSTVSISKLTPQKKGFKATWKKVSSATGYQIQYSTSSKFNKAKKELITKNGTTSKVVTKLTAKKKYYVRIRTYRTINGTKYYSSWSKAKTVTTKK